MKKHLHKISRSQVVLMDRWQIEITDVEGEQKDATPYQIINNYFSIGVDASIAHRFHTERQSDLSKFNDRLKNKLRYLQYNYTCIRYCI